MGELVKLSHASWLVSESVLLFQYSSSFRPRLRRFLDRINGINRMVLFRPPRKKKCGISRRDAGAQRKLRGTRDIWLSQRAQRLCGKISETSEPASSLYSPIAIVILTVISCSGSESVSLSVSISSVFFDSDTDSDPDIEPLQAKMRIADSPKAHQPVTGDVTNYFPDFYRCSVRCPQRRQPRYMLSIVQKSGAPRFAAYPRLSCSDFFPISFRKILSSRRQDRKGSNHLVPLRQIGFLLCLACFAPWRETCFPTSSALADDPVRSSLSFLFCPNGYSLDDFVNSPRDRVVKKS